MKANHYACLIIPIVCFLTGALRNGLYGDGNTTYGFRQVFDFQGFADATDKLTLSGHAEIKTDSRISPGGEVVRLRLDPSSANTHGTASYNDKIFLENGFEVEYLMQFSEAVGGGADNLQFHVTQDKLATVTAQTSPDFVVNFDTSKNAWDPSHSGLGIHNNGINHSVDLTQIAGLPFTGGSLSNTGLSVPEYPVRVTYYPGDLDVWLGGVKILSDYNVTLRRNEVLDADGKAYVSMVGTSGANYENHDLLSWSLKTPGTDLTSGLVAHYPFDGNASDMSGNGNHGTLVNGLSSAADRFSVSNRAAVFTGTQFLKTPEFGSEDITVSLWYKSNSDVSEDPAFFGNLIDSGANRHPLLLDKRDMKLGYYDSFWQVADYNMPKTTWVHLTMVASSSNWKLYVDGSLIGEKTNYFGNQNDPVKGFGNYVDTGSASPQGALDDIRIYNRALSAADVAGLYELERPKDSDFDGLFDTYETYLGTDPNVAGTDGDGLNDGQEVTAGTNPKVSDKTVIDAGKGNSANFGLAPLSNLTATGATPHTNGWYYQPEWGWVWTNANVFPYVYRSSLGDKQAGWLYFREGSAPP
jgi:hypothetical protein